VKNNLILQHGEDDDLLRAYVAAALDYARGYQHRTRWGATLPSSTEQAVVMLASHFYESRDGSTGGFFADNVQAGQAVWQTVNRLLDTDKRWSV
jgi:hypothetical protein